MTVTVRRLNSDDLETAAELLTRYSAANLTADEREAGGFVQGTFTPEKIEGLTAGTGGFVAEHEGAVAGVALTSAPGSARGGPPAALNEVAAARFGAGGYFMYGPAVVDEAHRRQGVLRALFAAVKHELGRDYPIGVAFVENDNAASLAAHRRLGLSEFASFEVAQRHYVALFFPSV